MSAEGLLTEGIFCTERIHTENGQIFIHCCYGLCYFCIFEMHIFEAKTITIVLLVDGFLNT